MPTRAAEELSNRVSKQFDRHFTRHARDVVVYVDPVKIDCTCNAIGPLGGVSVTYSCARCGGRGFTLVDSSACLTAIVASAEPRRSIMYGTVSHSQPASFHDGAFIVVFRIGDVILDPIGFPDRTIFEYTGKSMIGWGLERYIVKSYARDGIGAEENYLKVLVERTKE